MYEYEKQNFARLKLDNDHKEIFGFVSIYKMQSSCN